MFRLGFLVTILTTRFWIAVAPANAGYIQWRFEEGGNGHFYGLVLPSEISDNYSWSHASAEAATLSFRGSQGYLSSVTSASENEFLFIAFGDLIAPDHALIGGSRGDYAWIGLADDVTEGRYRWGTGEAFAYSNWAPPEPNNLGNEDYVHYWKRDYADGAGARWSWNDSSNLPVGFSDTRVGYFVEFSPPFTAATPVPEPSTTALAAIGAVSMIAARRKRNCNFGCHKHIA